MKFDDLDVKMRVYETAHDYCVVPEVYMVARIDGRGFTRLTKEVHRFESPYDVRFRDYMITTTDHLMNCGLKNELLFENGINFNDIPNWQKRGVGLYWEVYQKPCINPQNDSEVIANRRRIKVDYDLPMKEEYSNFISNFLSDGEV